MIKYNSLKSKVANVNRRHKVISKIITTVSIITMITGYGFNVKAISKTDISSNATANNVTMQITGKDYYEIGANISQKGWTTSDNVILASSVDFPDALSGTALGIKLNAPILFTDTNNLDTNTLNEISRLNAKKVYILGGTGAVSQGVEDTIKAQGLTVERLWGQDRFGTAVQVGNKLEELSGSKTAFLSNAYGFADALAGSTFAGQTGSPILLTDKDTLNDQTRQALSNWGVNNVYILGGTGVVSTGIENQLRDMGISVTRLGGVDRYDTSQKIVKNFDSSLDKFTLVTGKDYHNALVASVYANKTNHPILLMDDETSSEIKGLAKDKDLITVGMDLTDNTANSNAIVPDATGHTGSQIKQKLYGLGFVKYNDGVMLNKYGEGALIGYAKLLFSVLPGDNDMNLAIFQGDDEACQKIKAMLPWILPTQADKLYSILTSSGLKPQTLEMDGRTITITIDSSGVDVIFGRIKK